MNYYCEKCGKCTGDDGKDQDVINAPGIENGLCSECQDKADEKEEMEEQQKKLDTYLTIHDELVDRCSEWLDEFVYMGRELYDITAEVHNDAYPAYVIARYKYHNFGDNSHDGSGDEKIPLAIFWDYDFVDKEKKKRFDKQMAELKQREERKKVQDMKDKATRYEQFLKLSKEFDDEKD